MAPKNVRNIAKYDLCVGCGFCSDICPKHCIDIVHRNGAFKPHISNDCINCGLCLKICPGEGIELMKTQKELFSKCDNILYDKYGGYYINSYSGYSTNWENRYHGASGGLVTEVLLFLIRKKIIDGAVIVHYSSQNAIRPEVFIARTEEEIVNSRSSKYVTVAFSGIISEILKTENEKFVIVGLPCIIQGLRKYEKQYKKLKEKIIGHFALYCSSSKTTISQDYLLHRFNIKTQDIKYFSYRDEGCLGSMIFKGKNNEEIKKISYLAYFKPMRGFFNMKRCSMCNDHYGELSDISFGDIHVGNYIKDKVGISSCIIREPFWNNILEEMANKNLIEINEIDINIVNSSQVYMYKHKKGNGIVAAYNYRRLMHHPFPKYDINYPKTINIKFLIREFQNSIFRFMGKNKIFWSIIDLLAKLTKIPE